MIINYSNYIIKPFRGQQGTLRLISQVPWAVEKGVSRISFRRPAGRGILSARICQGESILRHNRVSSLLSGGAALRGKISGTGNLLLKNDFSSFRPAFSCTSYLLFPYAGTRYDHGAVYAG